MPTMLATLRHPITLEEWDSTGCRGTFNFECAGRRGWAHRTHDRKVDRWEVTIAGGRAWIQVSMPLKRGRTLKTAIADALAAFPNDPVPRLIAGQEWFGECVTIA